MNKIMLKKQYMMHSPKKKSSRLPSDFQEVEYIQGTGTQYINTLVIPTSKTGWEVEFKQPNRDSVWLFGADTGWQTNGFGINIYYIRQKNALYPLLYINSSTLYENFEQIEENQRYVFKYGNGVFSINGKEYSVPSFTSTLTNPIYINSINRNGTPDSIAQGTGKIYSLKFYEDNTIIRNFIPCYRKSDNEIGLYDIVNNQFYTNQGSGKFIAGRPIVNIDGYEQLDYIEKQYSASNSSYFDSGIPASNDLVVEAELFNEIGTTDGSCAVFGSRIGFKNKDYTLNFANAVSNGTKYDSRFGSNAYNYGSYLVEYPNNYHILTWGNGEVKINGETKLTMDNTSFQSTLNVFLFAGNSNGSVGFFEGSGKTKVKWLKMIKNGVLVRNFIPMERTSDGELGMYDLVTNTFFTNQGSGAFIKGDYI